MTGDKPEHSEYRENIVSTDNDRMIMIILMMLGTKIIILMNFRALGNLHTSGQKCKERH